MASLKEVEAQALTLTESDRASLAAELLQSLPSVLADADDGVLEAERRDEELNRDASAGVSFAEFRRSFGR